MVKYYVATNGSNSNDGLSPSTPFLTLKKATDTFSSGDDIEVAPGNYLNQPTPTVVGKSAFKIYGRPDWNSAHLFVDPATTYNGISFENCHGFVLANIRFTGNNSALTYQGAYDAYLAGGYVRQYAVNGILAKNCYNFTIAKCMVFDFPGGGIAMERCDMVNIDENFIKGCTKYSKYGNQAITFWRAVNSPNAVAGRVGCLIMNCTAVDNVNLIPWENNNQINEGWSFYSDTTDKDYVTQTPYTGRFIVQNCVGIANGAGGVNLYKSCEAEVKDSYFAGNNINVGTAEVSINTTAKANVHDNYICTKSTLKYLEAYGISNVNSPDIVFDDNRVRGTTGKTASNIDTTGNTFI